MGLDSIVKVNISSESRAPTQAGFGVLNILSASPSATWTTPERRRFYTSSAGVGLDFGSGTPEYKAAVRAFGQKRRPRKVMISRLSSKPDMQLDVGLLGSPINLQRYAFTLAGCDTAGVAFSFEIDYTADSSATLAEIVTGLAADVTSKSITGVTAAAALTNTVCRINMAAGGWITVALKDANGANTGPGLGDGSNLLSLASTGAEPATPLADQLDAILLQDKTWYAVENPYYSKAIAIAIADWVEANERIQVVNTSDTDVITTAPGGTDIAATLKASSYFRTAVLYHHDLSSMPAAAWAGYLLTYQPGKATWAMKVLSGPAVSELTETHQANVVTLDPDSPAKNGNIYIEVAGLGVTLNGKTAGGEWLDIVIGRDWFAARLAERSFGRMANLDKVPFTNQGIGVFETELRGQMKDGQNVGLVATDPKPIFVIPKAGDFTSAERNARRLFNIGAQGQFQGAIHAVDFEVTLNP